MDMILLILTVTAMTSLWYYLQKKTGYLRLIEKHVNNKFVYNFAVSCLILACLMPFINKMNKAVFWAMAFSTVNAFRLKNET